MKQDPIVKQGIYSCFLMATLAVLLAGAVSCQKQSGPSPATYDVLARDTGYWEWQRNITEGPVVSPATVGFSRQLTFRPNGQLIISHDRQVHSQVPYLLSNGPFSTCDRQQPTLPIITFTPEAQVPNNERKSYTVEATPAGLLLSLTGEYACVDGGFYETYIWHKE